MREANELQTEMWNEDTTAFPFTGNAKVDPRNSPILTLGPLFGKWVQTKGKEGMEPPALREVAPDHFARCHLADGLELDGVGTGEAVG